jgi:hypothetical protein
MKRSLVGKLSVLREAVSTSAIMTSAMTSGGARVLVSISRVVFERVSGVVATAPSATKLSPWLLRVHARLKEQIINS